MVAFEVACRERPEVEFITKEEILAAAPLSTQRERVPFRWQVEVRHEGQVHHVGIEPDAVFGLRFKDLSANRASKFYMLEVDRGTMPVSRKGLSRSSLQRKLLAYETSWRQGVHRTRFGMENFRVLFIVENEERRRHLAGVPRVRHGLFLETASLRDDLASLLAFGNQPRTGT